MCGGFLGDVFRIGTAVVSVAVAAVTLNPFAIVAAVGAVANVVGHYTGSKELQIAGGVLGAVGAIGGLANAAGLFDLADIGLDAASTGLSWGSEAAGAAGGLAADAGIPGSYSIAESAANAAGPVTVDTMPDLVGVAGGVASPQVGLEAGGNPFNGLNSVAANMESPGVIPSAAANTGVAEGVTPNVGLINQPTFTAEGGSSAALSTFGDANATNVSANVPGVTTPADPTAGVTGSVTTPTTPASNVPSADALLGAGKGLNNPAITVDRGASPDVWDKIWKFVDSNSGSRLTTGALMAGGAFLSGATSSLTPAQVDALQAQAEANRAAANLSRQQTALSQQQLANMNEALPVASRTPKVTGSVEPPPAPQGLINRPPRLAPVTGQVAA